MGLLSESSRWVGRVCVWGVLFDLVFQPVEQENGCRISLLYLLPADIRTLKRGARKAEMLVKVREWDIYQKHLIS